MAVNASMAPIQRLGVALTAAACTIGMSTAPALAARNVGLEVIGTESPVHVNMTVTGYTIKPASEGLQPKTGHFHILIDQDGSVAEGEAIPFDDTHKHYGKGQTQDDLVLSPGKHTLTLQFANALHESYGPKFATTTVVNIK